MTSPDLSGLPQEVRFGVGGDVCVGDLRLPSTTGPHPVVLMASGLGGVRAVGLPPYAERYVAAGYAVLTFDYRSFGDSTGHPRQVLNIAAQREDWRAAIAFAMDHPQLDPSRVVIWGTSFAGGHVLTLAAERRDIAAVIAQGAFTDGVASARALSLRSMLKIAPRALLDGIRSLRGHAPLTVESAGPPGSAALMSAPDAAVGVAKLIEAAGVEMDTAVSARIVLALPFDRPGRKLSSITTPTLLQVCSPDTVAPDQATVRHVKRAANPHIELQRINAGHFEIYHAEAFDYCVQRQLNFLAEHVPANLATE